MTFLLNALQLLEHQQLTLEDLFGENEAKAADALIEAAKEKFNKEVDEAIKAAKSNFDKLNEIDKEIGKSQAAASARIADSAVIVQSKSVICPACKSEAVIVGQSIAESEPKFSFELETIYTYTNLPMNFRCWACKLELNGYKALYHANLGDQFTVTRGEPGVLTLDSEVTQAYWNWLSETVFTSWRLKLNQINEEAELLMSVRTHIGTASMRRGNGTKHFFTFENIDTWENDINKLESSSFRDVKIVKKAISTLTEIIAWAKSPENTAAPDETEKWKHTADELTEWIRLKFPKAH